MGEITDCKRGNEEVAAVDMGLVLAEKLLKAVKLPKYASTKGKPTTKHFGAVEIGTYRKHRCS